MRIIAHISDPHFGTEDPVIAAALVRELNGGGGVEPSVIAISGDLTQRARTAQFQAARAFLDRLAAPVVVVPGNHDVPLYDLVSRFFHPFQKYCRHISRDLMPVYVDDELAVIGLTTAHGLTWKDGKVSTSQVIELADRFAELGARSKVLIAHHPFVLPAGRSPGERVDGAEAALVMLEEVGVEVICTGHLHASFASDTGGFRSDDRAIVAVHAGTCISNRRRGENNAYNRVRFDGDRLVIQQRIWDGTAAFVDGAHKAYVRTDGRWRHEPALPAGEPVAPVTPAPAPAAAPVPTPRAQPRLSHAPTISMTPVRVRALR